jgi:dinuclear metal center YbgI/SA1388 family protein
MKLTTRGFIELIDGVAPFSLAEPWDNSGLQAGCPEWPVRKVMTALDVSLEVMESAVKAGADLVLSHHPLLMQPVKSLDFSILPGSALALSAAHRISIVSAHTNIDKASPGLNDCFALRLGLSGILPLVASGPGSSSGFGRVGVLEEPLALKTLAARLKEILKVSGVRLVGDPDTVVVKAAVCTGSGGSLAGDALRSGAQVFITGDFKYHDARDVEAAGLCVLDVGHFASEVLVKEFFRDLLGNAAAAAGYELAMMECDGETDPFVFI